MDRTLFDADFLRKLEQLALVSRRIHRGRARGEHQNYRRGSSLEFADYRPYQAGDDLRRIDWNIWRRMERLFLKLFSAEEDLTIHILMDSSGSMGSGTPPKIDYARRVGAALGYIGISSLDRVGVTGFDAAPGASLPPLRRREQVFSLLDHLSRMTAGGDTALSDALVSYTRTARQPGLAVVISDLMDPAGYRRGLMSLRHGGFDVVLIQILAPEEFDPPLDGVLRLVDVETGQERSISVDRVVLGLYREQLGRYFSEVEEFCLTHEIEYIRTGTETPFEQLVLDYLRQGMHLS